MGLLMKSRFGGSDGKGGDGDEIISGTGWLERAGFTVPSNSTKSGQAGFRRFAGKKGLPEDWKAEIGSLELFFLSS